jgi:hypothetical protein
MRAQERAVLAQQQHLDSHHWPRTAGQHKHTQLLVASAGGGGTLTHGSTLGCSEDAKPHEVS